MLFSLEQSLTLIVLAGVGLAGFGVARSFGRITYGLREVLRRQSALAGLLAERLGGIRLVQACAAERHESARLARLSHGIARESAKAVRAISFLNAGSTLATGVLGLSLLAVAAGAVPAGEMTLGGYVMYAQLAALLLGPVVHLAAVAGDLGKALAAAGRIAEFRGLRTEEEEGARLRFPTVQGTVDFEEVTYSYGSGPPALRAVSFHRRRAPPPP